MASPPSDDRQSPHLCPPTPDPAKNRLGPPFAPHGEDHSALGHDNALGFTYNAQSVHTDAAVEPFTHTSDVIIHPRKPSEAGLHLQTDLQSSSQQHNNHGDDAAGRASFDDEHKDPSAASSSSRPPFITRRSYETRRSLEYANHNYSPASTASSPALTALGDITPLPSPIVPSLSSEAWKRAVGRPHSGSGSSIRSLRDEGSGFLPPPPTSSPGRKKKAYPYLSAYPTNSVQPEAQHSEHTRSISEYVPEPMTVARPRNVTTGSADAPQIDSEASSSKDPHMHREEYLATQRKLLAANAALSLPSPPSSNRSVADSSDDGDDGHQKPREQPQLLAVRDESTKDVRYWRPLRKIGRGAFSEVVLASSNLHESISERRSDPRDLVAIKIVAHEPASGANEERMETSIQREIDILRHIRHPCLPHMIACDDNNTRALLVMNYCPGGDLFEVASQHRELLTPVMIQRVFAEIVGAVSYLHSQYIVHRDIKLENILFNLHIPTLPPHPTTYPYPLTTLTDLGLSKRIPKPPDSPLLTHPCGSADYAAPELLLGQAYDGRATDAWALGVLLYALMEGRLPFDPLPTYSPAARRRHRHSASTGIAGIKHRIARCDWLWCDLGDEEGDWDAARGNGLDGAREVVEGLLKKVSRGRWGVEKLEGLSWVRDGIDVPGGLRRVEDESGS